LKAKLAGQKLTVVKVKQKPGKKCENGNGEETSAWENGETLGSVKTHGVDLHFQIRPGRGIRRGRGHRKKFEETYSNAPRSG